MVNRKRTIIEVNRGLMSIPRIDERVALAIADNATVVAAAADAAVAAVNINPTIADHETRISRAESRVVDVREYGAAESVASIQAAVANVEASGTGATIVVPAGIYAHAGTTTPITIAADNITLHFEPGAHLDCPDLRDNEPAILVAGQRNLTVTKLAAASAAVKGSRVITVASATGLSVGDNIVIRSGNEFGASGEPFGETSRPNYEFKSEWATIRGISGTTITLRGPLRDTYDTTSYDVCVDVYTLVRNVHVRGARLTGDPSILFQATPSSVSVGATSTVLTFSGQSWAPNQWQHHTFGLIAGPGSSSPSYRRIQSSTANTITIGNLGTAPTTGSTVTIYKAQRGIRMQYVDNCSVDDCTIDGFRRSGVEIVGLRSRVSNGHISRANEPSLGYGVYFLGSEGCTAESMTYVDCRHATDCNGGASAEYGQYAVARHCKFLDSEAWFCTSSGFSTHGASEYVTLQNLDAIQCVGGYVIRSRHTTADTIRAFGISTVQTGSSYPVGILIGEVNQDDGSYSSHAGTGLRLTNYYIDATPDETMSGTNVAGIQSLAPLIDAYIGPGTLTGFSGNGMLLQGETIRDTIIDAPFIDCWNQNGVPGDANHGLQVLPNPANGHNQKNLTIRAPRIKDARGNAIRLSGNSTSADPSSDVRILDADLSGSGNQDIHIVNGYWTRMTIEGTVAPDADSITGGTKGLIAMGQGNHAVGPWIRDTTIATKRLLGLYGEATWDPPSIANGAAMWTTVTVENARLGDMVAAVAFSLQLPQGMHLAASVSNSNQVRVGLYNLSGATQDIGSGTLTVDVIKR
jgi:hypothetical protein